MPSPPVWRGIMLRRIVVIGYSSRAPCSKSYCARPEMADVGWVNAFCRSHCEPGSPATSLYASGFIVASRSMLIAADRESVDLAISGRKANRRNASITAGFGASIAGLLVDLVRLGWMVDRSPAP